MLRMVLLGLLIPLGVGVLSAMELRTPRHSAVAIVQPIAEPTADISDSHDALAKADRLDVAAVSKQTPEQAVSIDQGIAPPQDIAPPRDVAPPRDFDSPRDFASPQDNNIRSSEPPKLIAHHSLNTRSKKVTTATRPKPEPKATAIKRSAISQHSKTVSDTEPCRLKAFGGLRKALDSTDCEI